MPSVPQRTEVGDLGQRTEGEQGQRDQPAWTSLDLGGQPSAPRSQPVPTVPP